MTNSLNPLAGIPTADEERSALCARKPSPRKRANFASRVFDPDFADHDLAERYRRALNERKRAKRMMAKINRLVASLERQAAQAGIILKSINDGVRVIVESARREQKMED